MRAGLVLVTLLGMVACIDVVLVSTDSTPGPGGFGGSGGQSTTRPRGGGGSGEGGAPCPLPLLGQDVLLAVGRPADALFSVFLEGRWDDARQGWELSPRCYRDRATVLDPRAFAAVEVDGTGRAVATVTPFDALEEGGNMLIPAKATPDLLSIDVELLVTFEADACTATEVCATFNVDVIGPPGVAGLSIDNATTDTILVPLPPPGESVPLGCEFVPLETPTQACPDCFESDCDSGTSSDTVCRSCLAEVCEPADWDVMCRGEAENRCGCF